MRAATLLLPLLALLAPACHWERAPAKKPINSYLADPRDLANVRRIIVLPFAEETGINADLKRIRDAFLAELAKLRRFEIVPLSAEAAEDDVLNRTLHLGRLSTEAMVAVCERFHVDGVLFANITNWRPYKPQVLGLRTQLLSVHSGATVWAVDVLYDCSDRSTIADLKHYDQHVEAADATMHGWELLTIAPTMFAAFVAHRVVGTWIED